MLRLERIIELLKEQTKDKTVVWEKDDNDQDAFNLVIGKYIIQVMADRPNPTRMHIYDNSFHVIDLFQDVRFDSLFTIVRQQVMHADEAIDYIIKHLETPIIRTSNSI